MQERKRIAVKEDRRVQEMSSRQNPPDDNFERTAMKAMGAMEEGDAVFGSSGEINLDSQVSLLFNCIHLSVDMLGISSISDMIIH